MTASVTMAMPGNIGSFVLGTQGTITNSANSFQCPEADAATILLNMPHIVNQLGITTGTTISLPPNISAVTIGTATYTPDASGNITIPDLDATTIVQTQLFALISATATNPG